MNAKLQYCSNTSHNPITSVHFESDRQEDYFSKTLSLKIGRVVTIVDTVQMRLEPKEVLCPIPSTCRPIVVDG